MERAAKSMRSIDGDDLRSRITFGSAKVKGPRKDCIEDYSVARVQKVDGEEVGLFAVMDGHSGPHVAVYLKEHLFDVITSHPDFWENPQKAIVEAYHDIDERILDMGSSDKKLRVGSTATTALLLDNGQRLIVANVGDSRAVLSRGGFAIDLSVDHEPQKPEEREMVESKGGEVSRSVASGVYRVDHRLAMSRAFGDYDLKDHISVEPDLWEDELDEYDEFFVIASDGVWHVMSSQEVVDHIRCSKGTAKELAKSVVAEALERRSTDDISCLVVLL